MNSIVSDLKCIIDGEVSCLEKDLDKVSQDFGGIIQKRPQVVIRPQNSTDVVKVVNYALNKNLTISSRAAGHSLSGQGLNQDGILVDMRSLNKIYEFHPDQMWFKADTGVTWSQIVDTSIPQGVIPPVLTNYFDVTIGGTHSVGGIGQSSFRYGTQADNCLGLEVVTGTGELLWCSKEENSELFNHVLAGYGQFGFITKIKHKLRKYRPFTRTYFFCYDNLSLWLKDKHFLASSGKIDGLLSLFSPCILGISRTEECHIKPIIEWFYRMQVTVEMDSKNDFNEEKFLSNLSFYRHVHTENMTFDKFIQPVAKVSHLPDTANPWIDVLLPASKASRYIETALSSIPSFIDFRNTAIGSFSMFSSNTKIPMFSLPQEEFIIGFGMYPTVPKSQIKPVLEKLNLLTDLGFQLGGKRYTATWVEFEQPQWQVQFGNYWSKVNEMKRKYDPKGLLNPGFLKYKNAKQ
ncbi:MAG: FAD-binding protein [Scytonematopsis contorta HA4267-MV1]|jgi:FAD/FMN-containing dehydrogenase|nr:FAD-binding protein [Scytonematopsis contorta HA4267-MV1]